MFITTRPSRLLAAAIAGTLSLSALAVLVTGQAAAAAPSEGYAPSIQIGYTDSDKPGKAYGWAEQVDLPLGARLDAAGQLHKSRVYATFELSQWFGSSVLGATVSVRERSAADCAKRSIELWHTETVVSTPKWANPPRELAKVDEIHTAEYCPTADLFFDVATVVRDAVAAGRTTVTLELRVPQAIEGDVSYGRTLNWYNSVSLKVAYNSAPVFDESRMSNGGRDCAGQAPHPTLSHYADRLQVWGSDPDLDQGGRIGYDFAIWPAGDPAHRTEFTTSDAVNGGYTVAVVPAGVISHGGRYSWQARTNDGLATSAWSRVCTFDVDTASPSAPQLSSTNYPQADTGQLTPIGVPGAFTFAAGGDADTIGFDYAWFSRSQGPSTSCQNSTPWVCEDPWNSPRVVLADVPGGTATASLVPPNAYDNTLWVQSVDRAGNRSAAVGYAFRTPPTAPSVQPVGTPQWGLPMTLTFVPAAGTSGITAYEYALDNGATQTVPAAADGTASISFVAGDPDGHSLNVRSRSANGWVSPQGYWNYTFSPYPVVTSDIYLFDGVPHGGVGVIGTFTFNPPPGWTQVTNYLYSFNGQDFVEVPTGPDGRATVSWTPTTSGQAALDVLAVAPGENYGELGNYPFLVG